MGWWEVDCTVAIEGTYSSSCAAQPQRNKWAERAGRCRDWGWQHPFQNSGFSSLGLDSDVVASGKISVCT